MKQKKRYKYLFYSITIIDFEQINQLITTFYN